MKIAIEQLKWNLWPTDLSYKRRFISIKLSANMNVTELTLNAILYGHTFSIHILMNTLHTHTQGDFAAQCGKRTVGNHEKCHIYAIFRRPPQVLVALFYWWGEFVCHDMRARFAKWVGVSYRRKQFYNGKMRRWLGERELWWIVYVRYRCILYVAVFNLSDALRVVSLQYYAIL